MVAGAHFLTCKQGAKKGTLGIGQVNFVSLFKLHNVI